MDTGSARSFIALQDELIPHAPVLLLFATSAQTHIFPEIRIDAVRFLDIYLEYIPEVVTEGWMYTGSSSHGRRVLEGYLGILNAGTTFGEGGGMFGFRCGFKLLPHIGIYADTGPVQATSTASVVLSPAVSCTQFHADLRHAFTPSCSPSLWYSSLCRHSYPTP